MRYERDFTELEAKAKGVARILFDADNGELSIYDDLVQEALLAILELPETDLQDDLNTIWRTIRNYLAKYRERGYKVKLWQNSLPEEDDNED